MTRCKRGRSWWILCPWLVLAASGCDELRSDAGWTERDSVGIRIVENDHTQGVWTQAEAWRLSSQPSLQIGTVAGDEEYQFYRIRHVNQVSDGRIAVVNTGSYEVRLFDPRGAHLLTIGGEGDGPGEFRSPWFVFEAPGDSIVVIDLYREVSIFNDEGEFIRRFLPQRPDGRAYGEGFAPVAQFGDGSLLFREYKRNPPPDLGIYRNRIGLYRLGLDGTTVVSLGEFDDQTLVAGGYYHFGARAQEAVADSTIWYGPGDRFELREIAPDGSTIRLIRLDRPPRPVTEQDVVTARTSILGEDPSPGLRRLVEGSQAAPVFPHHYEIQVDADGNLWVQDYQPFGTEADRLWSIFDPRGRFLGDVRVPAGLRIHQIGPDYVLGVTTDAFDVEYVVMYGIEKPMV